MLVGGRELIASIVSSLAWPVVVLIAVYLMRDELRGAFKRIQSLEFAGSKATFAVLGNYEVMIAAQAKAYAGSRMSTFTRLASCSPSTPSRSRSSARLTVV